MSFTQAKALSLPPILYTLHAYWSCDDPDRQCYVTFPAELYGELPKKTPVGYTWCSNWKCAPAEYGTTFSTLLSGVRGGKVRVTRRVKKWNDKAGRTLFYRLATPTGAVPKDEIFSWRVEVMDEVGGSDDLGVKARAGAYVAVLEALLGRYQGR